METATHYDERAVNQAQLKGWNWGAFGLTWIWGIAHRTPISLLVLFPVLGWFGMPVVLGLKGNQWAWQNRSWRDYETFRRHQRSWAKAALIAWLGAIAAVVIAWNVAATLLGNSDAFQLARTELQADPEVNAAFGTPLVFGTPTGNLSLGGAGGGTSELKFAVTGPRAEGTAYVVARRALDTWQLESGAIQLKNGSRLERAQGTTLYRWTDSALIAQNAQEQGEALQPLAAEPTPTLPLLVPTGVLPEAAVKKTEARHHREVRFCMNQDKASSAGSIRAQFVVDPDGHVDSVDVTERAGISERTETCLVQALKRWKFQPPKGGSATASLLLKR